MNPRIANVAPQRDYHLELEFTNEERGVYDCSQLLELDVFQELRDPEYFRQVQVLNGAVVWPHKQDICPDTLYLDSQKV